jgi:Brp/Blh family beta-carotene 15,15'-monooxygenase
MGRYRYIISTALIILYAIISWYSHTIALYYSYSIVLAGLFVVGIPHGAVDHLLIADKKNVLVEFIIKYLVIIVAYFILWLYYPSLALIIFIIYSAFHFGESELEELGIKNTSIKIYATSFLLGLSILMFIICMHFNESLQLLSKINGLDSLLSLKGISPFQLYIIPSLAFLYILFQATFQKHYSLLAVLLLLVIGVFVPLLLSFALYFICQHSYNAWKHVQKQLEIPNFALYKKTIPYTIGALFIFLFLLVFVNVNSSYLQLMSTNFFMFLACISLPHFLLMHVFYKSGFHNSKNS